MINREFYHYEYYLIHKAKTLISEKEFNKAYLECLIESNHGHSGFTEQCHRIFIDPQGKVEQEISDEFAEIHHKVAEGLIQNFAPVYKNNKQPDGITNGANLDNIRTCLQTLRNKVDLELVDKFRNLYEELNNKNMVSYFYGYKIEEWLEIAKHPDYLKFSLLPEKLYKIYENDLSKISYFDLCHRAKFFGNGKIKDFEIGIHDLTLKRMAKAIHSDIFILMAVNINWSERHTVQTMRNIEGVPIWTIYLNHFIHTKR